MARWTILSSFAVFLCLSASVEAAPVRITQTFGPATTPLDVNGTVQVVTGSWIFEIQTDTSNPDLTADTFTGRFATSSVTVSNTGLGLVDVAVVSHRFYYEVNTTRSGITNAAFSNGTVLSDGAGAIGNPNVIEPGFLDYVATFSGFAFNSTDPLVLADGTRIRSNTTMTTGSQRSVPEPSTLALASLALAVCGWRRRARTG